MTLATHLTAYKAMWLTLEGDLRHICHPHDKTSEESVKVGDTLTNHPVFTSTRSADFENTFVLDPRLAVPTIELTPEQVEAGWTNVVVEVKVTSAPEDVLFSPDVYTAHTITICRVIQAVPFHQEERFVEAMRPVGLPAALLAAVESGAVHAGADYDAGIRCAARFGDVAALIALFAMEGTRPQALDNMALRLAAQHGRHDALRVLMAHPATDVHVNSDVALVFAARGDHVHCVEALLEDASVGVDDENVLGIVYAVQYAVDNNNMHILRLLLDRNPSAANDEGRRIDGRRRDNLYTALTHDNMDMVCALLEAAQFPAKATSRVFEWAVKHSHTDLLAVLLEREDVPVESIVLRQAAEAALANNLQIVKMFLGHRRVDLKQPLSKSVRGSLFYAADIYLPGYPETDAWRVCMFVAVARNGVDVLEALVEQFGVPSPNFMFYLFKAVIGHKHASFGSLRFLLSLVPEDDENSLANKVCKDMFYLNLNRYTLECVKIFLERKDIAPQTIDPLMREAMGRRYDALAEVLVRDGRAPLLMLCVARQDRKMPLTLDALLEDKRLVETPAYFCSLIYRAEGDMLAYIEAKAHPDTDWLGVLQEILKNTRWNTTANVLRVILRKFGEKGVPAPLSIIADAAKKRHSMDRWMFNMCKKSGLFVEE